MITSQTCQRAQLVDQVLEAKKQLAAARSDGDQNFYESKCATLYRQIDNLVYELYDLTDDEIAIVEGSQVSRRDTRIAARDVGRVHARGRGFSIALAAQVSTWLTSVM